MTKTSHYQHTTLREGYSILAREVELHNTELHDKEGRLVEYETTIEAIGDTEGGGVPGVPRTWRVWGRQLRNGRSFGRYSVPQHVYSIREARTLARTLFQKHKRYVERSAAQRALRAASAEEDLDTLSERL